MERRPAVVWAPFFLSAHALASVANALGIDVATDGFSIPYRWFSAVGTAVAASIGLLLAFRIARGVAEVAPAVVRGDLARLAVADLPVPAAVLAIRHPRARDVGARHGLALSGLERAPLARARRADGVAAIVHPIGVAWALLPLTSLLGLDAGTRGERLRAVLLVRRSPWGAAATDREGDRRRVAL